MHLAEGILPAAQAVAWAAASAPFVIHSARRLRDRPELRSRFGVATALAFAVTLFPIPVPGLGATSHMCATPMLALLLGPSFLPLPMTLVLLVQALLFAHGGVSTLGANVFTLGIAGPWVAWFLAKGFRRLGLGTRWTTGLACLLGATAVYGLDAVMLGLALRGAQPFSHWIKVALLGFAPVQGPLLLLEGALSAMLVASLARRREALVPAWLRPRRIAAALVVLLCLAVPMRAGEPIKGLDESVLENAAVQAGRHPKPLMDWTDGETGMALFLGGGLVAGFFLGRNWERLKEARSHEPAA